MYLIPADIHTKRIIRFTVTSQHTTTDDIRRDWSIISKIASNLLADTGALDSSLGDNVKGDGDKSVVRPQETEEIAPRMDKAQVELWIDKAWNQSRRPMRSLSCNSEPLPYSYLGPRTGYAFEIKLSPQDEVVSPTLATTGGGPTAKMAELPSKIVGKQIMKKLTKVNSVPSFRNQWAQGGHHQLCCSLKVTQAPKHLISTCRRINCLPSSPITHTAVSPTSMETTPGPKLL